MPVRLWQITQREGRKRRLDERAFHSGGKASLQLNEVDGNSSMKITLDNGHRSGVKSLHSQNMRPELRVLGRFFAVGSIAAARGLPRRTDEADCAEPTLRGSRDSRCAG